MEAREPKLGWNSAAEVLSTLLPHLPIAGRLQEYRVWEVWEEVVGAAIAREAQPRKIQHGKLFVIVSNSAWMQELHFAKVRIRDQLNRRLGAPVVKDLFFVLGRIPDAEPRPPVPARRPLPPFRELTLPALDHPALEAAFAALLTARRRRLMTQEFHD